MKSFKRWAVSRLLPHSNILVLAYHRIANLEIDPQLLCVSPKHFREHLQVITGFYTAARLDRLHEVIGNGRSAPRQIVITFDDGYYDDLTQAVPLLEEYKVPATVFVVTGLVERNRYFYWDILAHIFLSKSDLPDCLALNLGDETYRWKVEPHIDSGEMARSSWTVLSDSDPLARCRAYRELAGLLKNQTPHVRTLTLDYLLKWANVSPAELHPHYDTLSQADIELLARHGLIEIGSHTISHPTLALLSLEEQRREIVDSKHALEEMIGRPVSSFSYPYGARSDFRGETVRLVRQAGFEIACANFEASTGRRANMYAVPRFLVRDWDGDAFQMRVAKWFERY